MSLMSMITQVTSLLARILSIIKSGSPRSLGEQGDFPEALEGGRGARAYMAPPTSRPPPQSSSEKPAFTAVNRPAFWFPPTRTPQSLCFL